MKAIRLVIKISGIFLLLASVPLTGQADLQTISNGRSLVISCKHALKILASDIDPVPVDIQTNAFICFSYISGVMGGAHFMEHLDELRYARGTSDMTEQVPPFKKSCIDWNIQYQEAAKIVVQYGERNPVEQEKEAYRLVIYALSDSFPCNRK